MPNVEEHELFYPILYLWRRELPDSGGAGKFRGGNSAELAFIPHKTERINFFTATGHCAVPPPSIFGGYPSSTTRYTMRRGAQARDLMKSTGKLPAYTNELRGHSEYLAPKSFNVPQEKDDAFILSWAGAGGYGDPLERDPHRVRQDVLNGTGTREWANRVYCVVLDEHNAVDAEATAALRNDHRRQRKVNAPSLSGRTIDAASARQVQEGLLLAGTGHGRVLACSKCHAEICAATANYKTHCATLDLPVTDANPHVVDPRYYIDDEVTFRLYSCPICGLLIQTEILRPGDEPLSDLEIHEEKRTR
jgi:N-methylhydantoinase B